MPLNKNNQTKKISQLISSVSWIEIQNIKNKRSLHWKK